MDCVACHALIPFDSTFCPMCGVLARAATGPTQRLSQPSAQSAATTAAELRCLRCQQAMVRGFLPDFDDRTGAEPSIWVDGQPERNCQSGRMLVRTQATFAVVGYRCIACGYLELYAREQI